MRINTVGRRTVICMLACIVALVIVWLIGR